MFSATGNPTARLSKCGYNIGEFLRVLCSRKHADESDGMF